MTQTGPGLEALSKWLRQLAEEERPCRLQGFLLETFDHSESTFPGLVEGLQRCQNLSSITFCGGIGESALGHFQKAVASWPHLEEFMIGCENLVTENVGDIYKRLPDDSCPCKSGNAGFGRRSDWPRP